MVAVWPFADLGSVVSSLKSRSSTFPTMEVIRFAFIWIYFYLLAPGLNGKYSKYSHQTFSSQIPEKMADSSDGESLGEPSLKRVFSSLLVKEKTWFVLSTALCTCKPLTYCSSLPVCKAFCRWIPTCKSRGSAWRWRSSRQFPMVLQETEGESLCCNHLWAATWNSPTEVTRQLCLFQVRLF